MSYNNNNTNYGKHKSPVKYAFYNSGNVYLFNPDKPIYDVRDPNRKQTALTYHVGLVKLFNNPTTFVLDDKGNFVAKSAHQTRHVPANWRKILKAQK